MQYNVGYAELTAATMCKSKNDIRFYFNDYLLDGDNGKIVTTEGHIMFTGDIKGDTSGRFIVKLGAITFKKYDHVVFDTEQLTATFFDKTGCVLGTMPITIVDANYPDWRRVAWEGDGHDVEEIAFRAEYIQTACKIAKLYDKHAPFKMQFEDAMSAVRITFKDSASTLHVMPCRI